VAKLVKKTKSNLKGAGPGRPKGGMNKTTALLKDAILMAAQLAGSKDPNGKKPDKDGLVQYLKQQAMKNPTPFMGLLGKTLPKDLNVTVNQLEELTDDQLREKIASVAKDLGTLAVFGVGETLSGSEAQTRH